MPMVEKDLTVDPENETEIKKIRKGSVIVPICTGKC